jgi:hypothetical protein
VFNKNKEGAAERQAPFLLAMNEKSSRYCKAINN